MPAAPKLPSEALDAPFADLAIPVNPFDRSTPEGQALAEAADLEATLPFNFRRLRPKHKRKAHWRRRHHRHDASNPGSFANWRGWERHRAASKGGKARAKAMSAEARKRQAVKAALARWHPRKTPHSDE